MKLAQVNYSDGKEEDEKDTLPLFVTENYFPNFSKTKATKDSNYDDELFHAPKDDNNLPHIYSNDISSGWKPDNVTFDTLELEELFNTINVDDPKTNLNNHKCTCLFKASCL